MSGRLVDSFKTNEEAVVSNNISSLDLNKREQNLAKYELRRAKLHRI